MDKKIVDSWSRYKKRIEDQNARTRRKYQSLKALSQIEHDNLPWYKRMFDLDHIYRKVNLEMEEATEIKEATLEGYFNWEESRANYKSPEDLED